jgi:ATP-dependent helicase YprA (DUF1998 family)
VVVDEAHMYTGTFGAHVAGVLRRLVRLCFLYENDAGPRFICCSATIANPAEHFENLVPLSCLGGPARLTVVDKDYSPRGKKLFVIWNPPAKPDFCQPRPAPGPLADEAPFSAPPRVGHRKLMRHVVSRMHHAGKAVAAKDPCGEAADAVEGKEGGEEEVENPSDEGLMADAQPAEGQDASELPLGDGGEELGTVPGFLPRRRSTIVETAMIFSALVKQRIRTLAFCKVRKLVEMVLRYTLQVGSATIPDFAAPQCTRLTLLLRQDLHATAPELAPLVKGYRGGYTKADRREIEAELFGGRLLGVTATCALELGVDVGNLDATLHMGFPGTISSMWQQAGRAGRAGRDSMAILVCFETPVDQHFARKPEELLSLPPEKAIMDPANQFVLRGQLLCAASEEPLGPRDRAVFGDKALQEGVRYLREADQVAVLEGGMVHAQPWVTAPHRDVNLRMIDPITFEVQDESRERLVIDHVGYTRSFFELFEGAIYMHQAKQYLVVRLDLETHTALVRPVRVGYYTSSRNHTDVNLVRKLESTDDGRISSGYAQVVAKVWGYRKIWLQTGQIFEMGTFSLPPLEYDTCGFFIDLDVDIQREVEAAGACYVGGIHAVNHALLSVTPLFLLCDPGDIDTEHVYPYQQRPRPPRIVLYDKRPGGIGAAHALFE